MNLLYAYIVSPFETIRRSHELNPGKVGYIGVLVVSSTFLLGSFELSYTLLFSYGVIVGLISCGLVIHCMVMDFFAQLFCADSKSCSLFNWMALSLIPSALFVPLYLFSSSFLTSGLASLLHVGLIVFIFVSQLLIIKHLYATRLIKAFFVYFSFVPFWCILLFLTLSGLGIIVSNLLSGF